MNQLIDRYQRKIDYLRISVTDRCDLRCQYCIPEGFKHFTPPEQWLNFDEIERLVKIQAQMGIRKVRLTGGEPLLRQGLPELVARLRALPGIDDLSISTNATQLAGQAQVLKDAGVTRLNVSLDSLQRDRFVQITGRDRLEDVLQGLQAAKAAGFQPIKINMVVLPGINDDEIDAMVSYCIEHGFVLRLIEIMPMGATGRNAGYVDMQPIKQHLVQRFDLINTVMPGGGPARYLSDKEGRFTVGFITPLSQHFCDSCNRIRLGVDGRMYLCLGQEHSFDFRPLLREGADEEALRFAMLVAIGRKPEKHDFREKPRQVIRFMNATGG